MRRSPLRGAAGAGMVAGCCGCGYGGGGGDGIGAVLWRGAVGRCCGAVRRSPLWIVAVAGR